LKTIDLVFINAGGGHQAAAIALQTVIREQNRPWRVRLINLFDVLDRQQLFRRATGLNPEDIYNKRLAYGWTLGLTQELRLLQALIRLGHKTVTRRLQQHWQETKPDMVVSLVPNFNRSMYAAVVAALPGVPYVTILTDFADYPPHFWIEPDQEQHFICGTAKAALQALSGGMCKSIVHETSGMIIRPDFYRRLNIDRRVERRKLGLDADRPTAIVLFGGHGSRAMQVITDRLYDTQLILLCGHNVKLAERLRRRGAPAPRHIVGFTAEVRYFMALSDFFIGKPGPGSISEAIHQGLPVIVVRNAYTMPQERYNTEWVQENGAGVVLTSFKGVRQAAAKVSSRLAEFKVNLDRVRNQAVFEIPDIIARIFGAHVSSRNAHPVVTDEAAPSL
jgi:UDP-N-acetylglucosamine:LPS N-acetylglucosamine transferase